MKNILSMFRNDLYQKKPVKIGVEQAEIMLSLNESPYNPIKFLWEEFLAELKNLEVNRYFQPITNKLMNELISYIGNDISNENILWGNGADEMLYYFFVSLRDMPNDSILTLNPTYFDYKSYSSAVGMNIKLIELNDDFSLPYKKIIKESQSEEIKAIIICNPNNPTGNLFDEDKIIAILDKTDKIVLIDEAYFEFSGKSYVGLISQYPNLLILRTFSKGFSSAGLRFGYLIGNKDIIYSIKKVMTAFNMSLLTQTLAYVLLKNKDIVLQWVNYLKKERDRIIIELRNISGITPFSSTTNFILFSSEDHVKLYDYLLKNGISIRNVSNNGLLRNCLRITPGFIEENDRFIDAVKQFYS